MAALVGWAIDKVGPKRSDARSGRCIAALPKAAVHLAVL